MFRQYLVGFNLPPGTGPDEVQRAVEVKMSELAIRNLRVEEVDFVLIKELAAEHGMRVGHDIVPRVSKRTKACPDCEKTGCAIWYVPDGNGLLRQRVCRRCGGKGIIGK